MCGVLVIVTRADETLVNEYSSQEGKESYDEGDASVGRVCEDYHSVTNTLLE